MEFRVSGLECTPRLSPSRPTKHSCMLLAREKRARKHLLDPLVDPRVFRFARSGYVQSLDSVVIDKLLENRRRIVANIER